MQECADGSSGQSKALYLRPTFRPVGGSGVWLQYCRRINPTDLFILFLVVHSSFLCLSFFMRLKLYARVLSSLEQ